MSTLLQIKSIATRARATLVEDTLGGMALVVILVVSLHLPTFF